MRSAVWARSWLKSSRSSSRRWEVSATTSAPARAVRH
jgi:hypothetical protein